MKTSSTRSLAIQVLLKCGPKVFGLGFPAWVVVVFMYWSLSEAGKSQRAGGLRAAARGAALAVDHFFCAVGMWQCGGLPTVSSGSRAAANATGIHRAGGLARDGGLAGRVERLRTRQRGGDGDCRSRFICGHAAARFDEGIYERRALSRGGIGDVILKAMGKACRRKWVER